MREFYLKTISLSVNRALDDLASFATEKQILRHMKSRPPPGRGACAVAPAAEKRRPLKPIVITRDKLQKEVFGMGYKNLPVLSIEEFYEQGPNSMEIMLLDFQLENLVLYPNVGLPYFDQFLTKSNF